MGRGEDGEATRNVSEHGGRSGRHVLVPNMELTISTRSLDKRHYWLELPIARHATLMGILAALTLMATVPFAFLDYVSALSSLFLFPAIALVAVLAVPLASIMYLRRPKTNTFAAPMGYENLTFGLALGATALAIAALVNVSLEFSGCSSGRTQLDLLNFTFNATCADANATLTSIPPDWKQLRRHPFFAFEFLWLQGCLDDLPVVVFLLIVYALIAAVCIVVAISMWNVRRDSLARAWNHTRSTQATARPL